MRNREWERATEKVILGGTTTTTKDLLSWRFILYRVRFWKSTELETVWPFSFQKLFLLTHSSHTKWREKWIIIPLKGLFINCILQLGEGGSLVSNIQSVTSNNTFLNIIKILFPFYIIFSVLKIIEFKYKYVD